MWRRSESIHLPLGNLFGKCAAHLWPLNTKFPESRDSRWNLSPHKNAQRSKFRQTDFFSLVLTYIRAHICRQINTFRTLFFHIGRQIDGIWHTAVVVFGREYFFGSHGISSITPVSWNFSLGQLELLFHWLYLYFAGQIFLFFMKFLPGFRLSGNHREVRSLIVEVLLAEFVIKERKILPKKFP